jgi:CRP-like cAMP-binding protein
MLDTPPGAVTRRFSRFVPIGKPELNLLGRLCSSAERFEARRTVISEGRRCDCMYLLVEGWAAEFRILPNGSRQVLRVRLPGEVFGLDCLAYGTALNGVQTLTECRVGCLSARDYDLLRLELPSFERALFLMLVFERAIGHEWIVSLGRRPAWSRISHLLLEISERCAISGLSTDRTPFPLTQQDVADCTGLTMGYVNRVLGAMRDRGLVLLGPRELAVLDRDALARFAGFKPRYLHPAPESLA